VKLIKRVPAAGSQSKGSRALPAEVAYENVPLNYRLAHHAVQVKQLRILQQPTEIAQLVPRP